jgi:hypothetical protein
MRFSARLASILIVVMLAWRAAASAEPTSPTSSPATAPAASTRSAQEPFRVYDALSFQGTPHRALTKLGMERIYVAGNEFWKGRYPDFDQTEPYEPACRALARKVARFKNVLVIDIEHWPVDIRKAKPSEVQESVAKLRQTVAWIRDESPELKLGFYEILPLRDYWTPVQYRQAVERAPHDAAWARKLPEYKAAYDAWQAANEHLRPLADDVDFVFPSLYTFYDDPAGWRMYAEANIEQAKRFGKPVLPFLWMAYHESNAALGGKLIDGTFWGTQLRTTRERAAGVVIWGGWQQRWDNDASWWLATKQFLDEKDLR